MIVVATPTGQIGRQVVDDLLERDAPVRVIVRDTTKLSATVCERVETIKGLHGDPAVLAKAMRGADALFWLVPPDPKAASVDDAYAGFTRPVPDAIREAGVRVVDITALGRGTAQANDAGFVTASFAMDNLLAEHAAAFRAVTNPSFFDNLLRQVGAIATKGVFFSAVDPALKLPACATRDIAAVSAALLIDSGWDGVGHVAVLGPEDLSFDDMAAIMADVLGKPIRCQRTSYDDYKAQMVGNGMSEAIAQRMADMARAKSEGLDQGEPRTTDNTTPTSFRQWCEDELKPAVAEAGQD